MVSGLGGEALEKLGLQGMALQRWRIRRRERQSLPTLLSQPGRLASVSPESLTIQRRVLDLAVDQVSGVWLASGMRQRGGVVCGAQKKGSG